MRKFLKVVLLCFVLLVANHIAKAQNNPKPYVPGELIVKFKEGNTSAKASHLSTKMQAQLVKKMPNLGAELWKIDQAGAKMNVEQLVEAYKDHPDIEFIEPNYLYSLNEDGPDPYINKQWALRKTGVVNSLALNADKDISEAIEIESSSDTDTIMVGILDTGIDWRHPDLIKNIWQNLGEDTDGDGVLEYKNGKWVFDEDDIDTIDTDNNGYIDDLIGWNFVDDNNKPFDYKAFEAGDSVQSHGTHVAGIIGATTNNGIGIRGVAKKVLLVPLKILTDEKNSTGKATDVVDAMAYIDSMNIPISNNSWGGTYYSELIEDAIEAAEKNNHLFIASAGNGGYDKVGDNVRAYYPATLPLDNIISVANTDSTDALNPSSNYSAYHIDIAAPGTDIYNCLPYNAELNKIPYGYKSGTSMAAPLVAGACALLWEKSKTVYDLVKVAHIKNVLIENSDTLPALKNKVVNSGRLNIQKALAALENEAYTDQYKNCRQRNADTLIKIHNILGLDSIEYAWDIEKPMETWNGVELNSLGCVTKLELPNSNKQAIPKAIGALSDLTHLSFSNEYTSILAKSNMSEEKKNEDIRESACQDYEYLIEHNADKFKHIIPLEIFGLKKLKYLDLENNYIEGAIPKEIGQLEQLEYLDLSYNHFTGEMPESLLNLTKLRRLNFSYNKLTGPIPAEIGQLENLNTLQLLQNELRDNIPVSIGNTDLYHIDLGYNNLTGEIPTVSLDRGVKYLYLDNNQLSGSLNSVFSWLYRDVDYVTGFDVSHNNLSGCYDPELASIGTERVDTGPDGVTLLACQVSDGGNNFDATWEDFTATKGNRAGICWASVTTEVWPGDMNNDGIVNEEDMVFYTLAKGNTGPSRDNPDTFDINENPETTSSTWEGKLCPDWKIYEVPWIDGKHQDANGDGTVDAADYEIIEANFGKEDPNRRNKGQLRYQYNDVELVLKIDEIDGNEIAFDLSVNRIDDGLGANAEGSAQVHSLAASIDFNNIVENASIDFVEGCLLESTYQFDEITKELTFFFERTTDIGDLNCDEVFARVLIIAVEDSPADGDKFLQFKTESINSETSDNVNKTRETNGYNSLGLDKDVDFIVQLDTRPERCKTGGTAQATVIGGDEEEYTYVWKSLDGDGWVETDVTAIQNLAYGSYVLSVSNQVTTQLIPFEIEYKPDYDADGELLNCEKYEEFYCPEDLNLTDNIPQDTYNAATNIYIDGTIAEDEEVELRAGDFIELEPGFIMENNTFLDMKIEGCSSDDIETEE